MTGRGWLIACAVACSTPHAPSAEPPPATPPPAPPPVDSTTTEIVSYGGVTVPVGGRVRTISFAGTIKPDESGHPTELELDAGHVGTFLGASREIASVATSKPVRLKEPLK